MAEDTELIAEYLQFAAFIKHGDISCIHQWWDSGYRVPVIMPSPLYTAALHGCVDAAVFFLQQGEPIDGTTGDLNYSPLMAAAKMGHAEIADVLLTSGADPNILSKHGLDALALGEQARNAGVIQVFRNHKILPSAIALLQIKRGAEAQDLIESSMLPIVDKSGKSALPEFFRHKRDDFALKLIREGADIDGFGLNGETALHIAIRRKDAHLARTLLGMGASTDLKGVHYHEVPPFILASALRLTVFVDLLIESGADIDIVDPWGKTALIHAVEDRHVNMVEHLLQRGCDPHIKYVNQAGSVEAIMDVFDIAPASNNRRLINVLDKYRSRV